MQRVDYVEAPPRVSSKLEDAFLCGVAAKLPCAAGDEFMGCDYCVPVRVLPVCVVQLRYCVVVNGSF